MIRQAEHEEMNRLLLHCFVSPLALLHTYAALRERRFP